MLEGWKWNIMRRLRLLDHHGTTFEYNGVTFDLALKGRTILLEGRAAVLTGRTVVFKGSENYIFDENGQPTEKTKFGAEFKGDVQEFLYRKETPLGGGLCVLRRWRDGYGSFCCYYSTLSPQRT